MVGRPARSLRGSWAARRDVRRGSPRAAWCRLSGGLSLRRLLCAQFRRASRRGCRLCRRGARLVRRSCEGYCTGCQLVIANTLRGSCSRGAHRKYDFEFAMAIWEEENQDSGTAREGELIVDGSWGTVRTEACERLLLDGQPCALQEELGRILQLKLARAYLGSKKERCARHPGACSWWLFARAELWRGWPRSMATLRRTGNEIHQRHVAAGSIVSFVRFCICNCIYHRRPFITVISGSRSHGKGIPSHSQAMMANKLAADTGDGRAEVRNILGNPGTELPPPFSIPAKLPSTSLDMNGQTPICLECRKEDITPHPQVLLKKHDTGLQPVRAGRIRTSVAPTEPESPE
jgi:hypothetical protein